MVEIMTPAATAVTRVLVDRIAVGDRAAFRSLYALLSRRVWWTAVEALPRRVDARAVTRATFIEVWHMARHHIDDQANELHAWIAAVTAGHLGERLRTLDTPGAFLDDYDRHVHCELAALLAPGPSNAPNRSRNARP
jgi:DNA-directed RNA polymerase specialized sigma24 family protein